jgi:hypothetical protein
MNALFAALLICGLGAVPARAASAEDILGEWTYDGFLYEGTRYPKPNPDLTLTFTFYEDGTDRLYWHRAGETAFCERLAEYSADDSHLVQKVIWVNPANGHECSSDTDMRMGLETDTEFSFSGDELWLHLELNGKPFFYILKSSSGAGSMTAAHFRALQALVAP